jgi:spore maturation protein CgeB
MRISILGLSITSSWGNGHATTFRGLVRELVRRGHEVVFLERDKSWYAENRDLPNPPYGRTILYDSLAELESEYESLLVESEATIVGSYVPDGVAVGEWAIHAAGGVCCFYDIDTPVTLAKLRRGDHEYVSPSLIPKYAAYLSFTGGPTLQMLEKDLGSPKALPLYCSVDRELYYPEPGETKYDLSYLGTYSEDRQPTVDRLLTHSAREWNKGRFCVAGPLYPATIDWPTNVERVEHLPPAEHCEFYNASRWTLNVTRQDMRSAGWSPSVRLFEAAACGTPVVGDNWPGLDDFFDIGRELVVAETTEDALRTVRDWPADEAAAVGRAAREKVLTKHTAARRAEELEQYLVELLG